MLQQLVEARECADPGEAGTDGGIGRSPGEILGTPSPHEAAEHLVQVARPHFVPAIVIAVAVAVAVGRNSAYVPVDDGGMSRMPSGVTETWSMLPTMPPDEGLVQGGPVGPVGPVRRQEWPGDGTTPSGMVWQFDRTVRSREVGPC